MKQFIIFSFLFLAITGQHHGGGEGKHQKEAECFADLYELNNSVEDLKSTVESREDLTLLREKLNVFLLALPNTLLRCMSVLEYDISKPVDGVEPNLSKIHDCKSAYVELINQMRRIAKAYQENNIEDVSLASSKLDLIRQKIQDYCSDYQP